MGERKGKEGKKSHEWSLSPSLFVRKWSLVHPFRERVDQETIFWGVLAHNVKL